MPRKKMPRKLDKFDALDAAQDMRIKFHKGAVPLDWFAQSKSTQDKLRALYKVSSYSAPSRGAANMSKVGYFWYYLQKTDALRRKRIAANRRRNRR